MKERSEQIERIKSIKKPSTVRIVVIELKRPIRQIYSPQGGNSKSSQGEKLTILTRRRGARRSVRVAAEKNIARLIETQSNRHIPPPVPKLLEVFPKRPPPPEEEVLPAVLKGDGDDPKPRMMEYRLSETVVKLRSIRLS